MKRAVSGSLRKTLPTYALFLVSEIVWMAIVPVAPSFADKLDLSKVEIGAVLASAGLTTLLVSLPIGLVSDRIGTRGLLRWSAAVVTISTLGQGLAPDFWSLLASRALFGAALGTIWTAGLAWMAEGGTRRRDPSALGAPVVIAGVGIMAGPAFSGLLADRFGLRAPFFVLAVISAVITVGLLVWSTDGASYGHEPLFATLRKARRERVVIGALVVMVVVGTTGGGVNVLVPLGLKANGFSAGETGVVFTGASTLFFIASIGVTRLGARGVSLRIAGYGALFYGAVMGLAVVSLSSAALVTFAVARAPFWAMLSTIAYPLGALGAKRAGLGAGAMMGVLNFVWGAAGSVGPLLAAGVAQTAGLRTAFAVLLGGLVAAGLWLVGADVSAELRPEPALAEGVE
jgi:predicted MFS family arabinose efflux permease